jgi:hypothetical protein
MKKSGSKIFVTNEMLQQAVDAVINGIEQMFKSQNKMLDKRFNGIENGIRDVRRRLTDIKLDTPSNKEFEDLKSKVERYHPLT